MIKDLTQREVSIIDKLAKGLSIKEVAESFNLSESTIKASLSTMRRVTEANNTRHLIYLARQQGLIK